MGEVRPLDDDDAEGRYSFWAGIGILVALVLFFLTGCKTLKPILDDPNKICPPNHVLTAAGCVVRPPVIAEPTATPTPAPPTPSPTSTPTPDPLPTATPEPSATPAPTATPTPAPAPDPCLVRVQAVLAYQLQQGHLTRLPGGVLFNDRPDGVRQCFDGRNGDRIDCATGTFISPGAGLDGGWWGVECTGLPTPGPTPVLSPAPVPTPAPGPTPTPGAYGCGGVAAARVGIKITKAPSSKPSCRWSPETGIAEGDCVLVADASVRGPKGSQADIPSGEAHLGWLPGCWWVVRPSWQQESQPDMELDLGVRHWMAPPDQATSVASWDVTEPPYKAQPFGSLARWQYDAAFKGSRSRIRACWPPDVPDPVCSGWYEVIHR